MRKPLIIANWKMNPASSKDAFDLAAKITKEVRGLPVDVVLCPPFVFAPQLVAADNVFIGAQDCFWEQEGAYTGEVSPTMLRNIGCMHVILGHSERKLYLGETRDMVQKKVKAASAAGLAVVLCVESAQELKEVSRGTSFSAIIPVFEPREAISTQGGKRVAPSEIQNVVQEMRAVAGEQASILYGGSVEAESIGEIMAKGGVQGALVGAASLDAEEFIALVKNAILP